MNNISLIITVVLLMCSSELRAQEHYNVIDGNPEWVYFLQAHTNLPGFRRLASIDIYCEDDCFARMYFDDVDDKDPNLHQLMCEVVDLKGNKVDTSKLLARQNPFVIARCRERENKIYGGMFVGETRFTNHTQTQYDDSDFFSNTLLIDFGLEVDDTLYAGDFNKKRKAWKALVTEKKTVTLDDGSQRHKTTYSLALNTSDNNTPTDNKAFFLIDGIGFINSVDAPFGIYYNHSGSAEIFHWWNLNCFIQNGKVVYIAPREGFENDEEYEGSTRFKEMPFYPDITPESVAEGTYTLPAAVEGISYNKTSKGKRIYNLQGQKTNGLQRGINIVAGRKVIVK